MTIEAERSNTAPPTSGTQSPSAPAADAGIESVTPRFFAPRMDTACYRDALLSTGGIPYDPAADYFELYG